MKPIRTFLVNPFLPPPLERQRSLIYNLRWAWTHDAIELFRWDRDSWERSGHNPVRMLGTIDQAALEEAAADEGFLAHLARVAGDFDAYMKSESTWFQRKHGPAATPQIAYFSAEFGLTDCLSIFAGGLGILAGDHLKSASDLGIPMVGVGLLYQQGYFRQYLNEAGWQQEAYVDNDFHTLPLTPACDAAGAPLLVDVPFPGRKVHARIWRAQVGRVPLYLLDTNIPQNNRSDQDITDQLYGGDTEMRLQQEMLLGIGGNRALEALGFEPRVYHLNEGHSAFVALERIRRLRAAHGLRFAEAREAVSAGLLFTTHTAVPAGHDSFSPALMTRYFQEYAADIGVSLEEILALGRVAPDASAPFCMTVLALRLARSSNGVSRLHARVTREMWQDLWPNVPRDEIPVGHVTNGVHFQSWISQEMNELYDRHLGPHWHEEPADQALWARVHRISAEELWRTHERRRERLVAFARRCLRAQLERRGAPRSEIEFAGEVLHPDILTIGFARRFAAYKRATLLLRDPDRLARILNDPDRPVQIIFAGQAHPRDEEGKKLIQQIATLARRPEFRRRLVFLEGYGMALARSMVQGADLWLSTPRRPLEASGTSGMKAAANGALNLSTLDGWWDEAWAAQQEAFQAVPEDAPHATPAAIGWAIGRGEQYDDPEEQDDVEAEALYHLLEGDVVPTFYERDAEKLPRQWIARMKASIATLCHFFNTHRMAREYTERFYLPALACEQRLSEENFARARELASWKERLEREWPAVRIAEVTDESPDELRVHDALRVRARVALGALAPGDVSVELYLGTVSAEEELADARVIPMKALGPPDASGACLFETDPVPFDRSGRLGYTVRLLPRHDDLATPFLPGHLHWAAPTSARTSP